MLGSLLKSFKSSPAASAPPAGTASAPAQVPPAPVAALPARPLSVMEAAQAANARVVAAQTPEEQGAAIAAAQAALGQDADDLVAALSLAGLKALQGAPEAPDIYKQAVALRPDSALLLKTWADALFHAGRGDEAIAALRLAMAAAPAERELRFALAMALLVRGAYREGFLQFRSRATEELNRRRPWMASLPAWEGGPLAGRRLLIWTDWGGYGDELLFARYILLTQQRFRPAALYVSCSAQNRRLFGAIEGVTQVFDQGGVLAVDCHAPLLDLPCLFGTDLDTVPAPVPYLRPAAADLAAWKTRLAGIKGLKVGLCWGSGFWSQEMDGARLHKSASLSMMRELCTVPGTQFVSLQKGKALAELAGSGLPILDFDADLQDMGDTAALACSLDLVITVDTSVSHLAGALGLPTLVLMPHDSGSFWLTQIENSPWYPSVRLLRQPAPGDWATPIARAGALLRQFTASGAVDVFSAG